MSVFSGIVNFSIVYIFILLQIQLTLNCISCMKVLKMGARSSVNDTENAMKKIHDPGKMSG